MGAGGDDDVFVVPDDGRIYLPQLVGERQQFLFRACAADAGSEPSPHANPTFESRIGQEFAALDEIGVLQDREPKVRGVRAEACECLGGDADDGGRLTAKMDGLADDGWIAVEALLPQAETQHTDWRGGSGVMRRIEEPPGRGGRAKLGEVIRADEGSADPLLVLVEDQRWSTHGLHHGCKGFCVLTVVLNRRIRHAGIDIFGRASLDTD